MNELKLLKQCRTSAKSLFTRTKNTLLKKIDADKTLEVLNNEFKRLEICFEDVIKKADAYAGHGQCPEEEVECNEWIEQLYSDMDEVRERMENKLEEVRDTEHRQKREEIEKQREDNEKQRLRKAALETETNLKEKRELIKSLALRRKDVIFQITECFNMISPVSTDSTEIIESTVIKEVKCNLDTYINQLHEINPRLISKIDEETEVNRLTVEYAEISRKYHEINKKAIIQIDRSEKSDASIKLKKFEMWKFDGNPRKYGQWKKEFQTHVRPSIKANQEVLALRSCVEANILNEFAFFGDNAVKLWERLDDKYGQKRKLVELIVNDIRRLRSPDNASKMIEMIDTIFTAKLELETLNAISEMNNALMLSEIEKKLGSKYKEEWIKDWIYGDKDSYDNDPFEQLVKFLKSLKSRLEYESSDLRSGRDSQGRSYFVDGSDVMVKPRCPVHPDFQGHFIWRCSQFKQMSYQQRAAVVKDNAMCIQCLQYCEPNNCSKPDFKCQVDACEEKHHTLLHTAINNGITFMNTTLAVPGIHSEPSIKPCLLQLQELSVCHITDTARMKMAASLWDSGSSLSLIKIDFAKHLQLTGAPIEVVLGKVGAEQERLSTMMYELNLITKDQKIERIQAVGVPRITNKIEGVDIVTLSSLFKVDPSKINRPKEGRDVDLLLGWEKSSLHPKIIDSRGDLQLMANCFGKIISGAHPSLSTSTKKVLDTNMITILHIGHKQTLPDFFTLEQMGVSCNPKCGGCKCGSCAPGSTNMTLKEEAEWKIIQENLIYDGQKRRWTFLYPWIKDPMLLPDNRHIAIAKLIATEKRLIRMSKEHAQTYCDNMQDLVNRNAAREVHKSELESYTGPKFYISHHAVMKPGSSSTPCRIVFNSSANDLGHIINSYWAKGPDILNPLLRVLMRFREQPVGVVGDI